MIEGLGVPFRDTSAAALSWRLGLPEQVAHAVLDVRVGGLTVQLRVLGASHQVLLRSAGPGLTPAGGQVLSGQVLSGPVLSETVACLPGARSGLPAQVDARCDGLDYRMLADVQRFDGTGAFEAAVTALQARYEHDPHALIGQFPGHPHAVTVLAATEPADAGTLATWATWHAYPGQGEIVRTSSIVQPATGRPS